MEEGRTMQEWVQSLLYSAPMAIVDCLLGELEFQWCKKQSGWRNAEFFSILGTWCMPLICHHQQCFCEVLPQWLNSSFARTAFPFSFSIQYSHPVIFWSSGMTKCHSKKMDLLNILMEKVIRLILYVWRTLFWDHGFPRESLRALYF